MPCAPSWKERLTEWPNDALGDQGAICLFLKDRQRLRRIFPLKQAGHSIALWTSAERQRRRIGSGNGSSPCRPGRALLRFPLQLGVLHRLIRVLPPTLQELLHSLRHVDLFWRNTHSPREGGGALLLEQQATMSPRSFQAHRRGSDCRRKELG